MAPYRTSVVEVRCVVDSANTLGEGPVWDEGRQVLWWVDIDRSQLQSFSPATGAVDRWEVPEMPGAVVVRRGGGLALAVASGLAFYDPGSGEFNVVAAPEPERSGNRFNDGKCDPRGRLWAGSMDVDEQRRTGALYRFDTDGAWERIIDGLGIPNTLAWSADETTFYFAETLDRVIHAYDYDGDRGTISGRRVFARTEPPGFPDGSCLDADGYLWNAEWNGWRVVRYAPDGSVDRVLDMPVERPTSCAFGGADLDVLYVTSARRGLRGDRLAAQPEAGGLFACDVGVAGPPPATFAG